MYKRQDWDKEGDINTGKIAEHGAEKLRAAFIYPLFSREECDLNRPAEHLGLGQYKIGNILIHKDKSYEKYHNIYHRFVSELDPKIICSVHGIGFGDHPERQADVLLGFGERFAFFPSEKDAKRFVECFEEKLKKAGVENIKLVIAKDLFYGRKNLTLNKHVRKYNETSKRKRLGLQVEFGEKMRMGAENCMPTEKCYSAVIALGESLIKYYKELFG